MAYSKWEERRKKGEEKVIVVVAMKLMEPWRWGLGRAVPVGVWFCGRKV